MSHPAVLEDAFTLSGNSIDCGCCFFNDSENSDTLGREKGKENENNMDNRTHSSRLHPAALDRKHVRASSLIRSPQTLDQRARLKNQRSNRKAITPATHQQRADSNTITSRPLWPAADKCGRKEGWPGGFKR